MTREQALAQADLRRLLEDVGESRSLHPAAGQYPCPDLGHAQSGDSPPVTVRADARGYDVWYCHRCEKGGTFIDALVASGRARDLADALDQIGAEKPQREGRRVPEHPGEVVATYEYRDAEGEPRMRVLRYEPKSFRQQRFDDGRWLWGVGDTELVPYRLPEALAAFRAGKPVFVVEGEKDADALAQRGHAATCNPGGAGKWTREMSQALAGNSHRVIVIGDDDTPGHAHAADAWRKFQGLVGQCIARLPAEGFHDVSEQLAAGAEFSSATLRRLPAVDVPVPKTNGRPGPMMLTARAMSARPGLGTAAQVVGPLLQRGMRTTIGAGTGEGKTSLALQAIRCLVHREPFIDEAWVPQKPGRALIIDLEQGEEVVKRRLREAGLDDSEAVDVLWEPAGLALDTDSTHQGLIRDTIAAGKYDLVLMDPLYQMHRGSGNDEQLAASLMNLVDEWARELGFCLVIPMHARKPHPEAKKNMTIHDIAGSGSWNRNAEFVLGLQVMSAGTSRVHFFKDRVGDGPELQSKWWLSFDRVKGFKHIPDPNERRAMLKALLARPEGVTEDELRAAGADDVFMRRVRKDAHPNGERWRAEPWHEQTALSTDVT